MSSNHNVQITISASNLSSDEFREVVADLKGVGTAADAANVHVTQTGAAAKQAGGGFKEMSAGATTAAGSLKAIASTAAGVALGNMMANAVPMMIAFGKASFTAASDFQESMSRVEVVFGDAADSVKAFADDATESLGMSEVAALSAAGEFGNLFTSMGMSQSSAAEMSTSIVALASDLASFNNIGTDVALEKLRAGLVGEIEPLRSLGVNLNAAEVQAKALSMGLATTAKELTAADKAQASYALILEQTTNAQGDYARTADGAANSLKELEASVTDLQVAIGQGLTPAVADFSGVLADNLQELTFWIEKAREADNLIAEGLGKVGIGDDESLIGSGFDAALGKAKDGAESLFYSLNPGIAVLHDVRNAADTATGALDRFGIGADEAGEAVAELNDEASGVTFAEWVRETTLATIEFEKMQRLGTEVIRVWKTLAKESDTGGAALGKQGRSIEELADAARMATGELTEYANASEMVSASALEAAINTYKLAESQDALAGAYQIGLEIQADYTRQGSEYAQQQSIIEKGNEILKKRLDEGTISQEEYNAEIAKGEYALSRYAGGQEDATLTARDYAIQNGELMRIQDEISAQFPELVRGSDEYNKKVEEAARSAGISQQAIDDMKGSNSNLAGVIANELIPALQDLINKILELDGKRATVTVETNFVSTGAPGNVGFTEFAEGGLVTAPTFALIGEAGPEVVVPLNKLPASAKADIMGNQQGAGNVTLGEAGWLPFIESLIGDLATASEAFSTEGLEHAQLFAETGSSAIATMVAALEFMNELGDQALVLTETHHQSLEAMNHLIYEVVRLMAQNAESINGDYLEAGKEFAEGAGAGVDAFTSGLELMAALDDTALTLTEEHHQALEATNHLLYAVVRLMAQNAESLNGPGLEAAVALADATSTIVGAMSDTLAFLTEISDLSDVMFYRTEVIAGVATTLADNARAIAGAYAETAATWDSGANPQIEAFSAAVGDSLSALTDTIDFLESINELGNITFYRVEVIAGAAKTLSDNAKAVADAFAAVAVEWDGSVNPSLTDFAEAIGDSTSGLSDVVDFLGDLSSLGEITFYSLDVTAAVAKTLADRAFVIADAFADAASTWDGTVNPQIAAFAEAAGDSLGLIADTGDALEAITTFGAKGQPKNLEKLADGMADTVSVIVQAIEQINDDWQSRGAPDITEFAEGAGASVGIMGDAADAFEGIAEASRLSKRQVEVFESNFKVVLALVHDLAVLAEPYRDDAEQFLDIITDIAESIRLASETIETVSGEAAASASNAASSMASLGSSVSGLTNKLGGVDHSGLASLAGLLGGSDSPGGQQMIVDPMIQRVRDLNDALLDVADGGTLAAATIAQLDADLDGLVSDMEAAFGYALMDQLQAALIEAGHLNEAIWQAPAAPPQALGVNEFLSQAAGFATDSSHLMAMIADLAAANNVADDPLTTDINETLSGIDQTFADEQVKLLGDILSNPNLFGGDVASQAIAQHVADALAASLDALGLNADQETVIQDALAAAGVSAFEGLPDLLASSVSQAITDSAAVQGEIMGQHVAAAVATVMRDFMAPGGFAAGFDALAKQQAFLHQGGL